MDKPVPYIETKTVMDFMAMQYWIDKKYGIVARDYGSKDSPAPDWVKDCMKWGITLERATQLRHLHRSAITDENEIYAYEDAWNAYVVWRDKTPYRDFWHYQLDLFHNFSNDNYFWYPLVYALENAEEDWQKEIAQMWIDEFGQFANEEGEVYVWVSW